MDASSLNQSNTIYEPKYGFLLTRWNFTGRHVFNSVTPLKKTEAWLTFLQKVVGTSLNSDCVGLTHFYVGVIKKYDNKSWKLKRCWKKFNKTTTYFKGQSPACLQGCVSVPWTLHLLGNQWIVGRIAHNSDSSVIFGCCSQKSHSAWGGKKEKHITEISPLIRLGNKLDY